MALGSERSLLGHFSRIFLKTVKSKCFFFSPKTTEIQFCRKNLELQLSLKLHIVWAKYTEMIDSVYGCNTQTEHMIEHESPGKIYK